MASLRTLVLLALVVGCGGGDHSDAGSDLPPLAAPSVRLLLPGSARLAGEGPTTCSHGVPASGDVWCAFTTTGANGADAGMKTELWVIDATRAAGETIACDGSSPHCRRLHADLWTGGALGGPLFPSDDHFDGDTLIFYAGGISSVPDGVYQGPVWAWRPAWSEPRVISSTKGLLCFGHERAAVAYCVENVMMGPPIQFDLRAGLLADAAGELPLLAVGVRPWKEGEIAWHAEFSPDGAQFALSVVEPSTGGESLHVGATAELGKKPLRELAYDATAWRIALDGKKLYYLQGFTSTPKPGGKLVMADFPSGANPVALQTGVASFFLLGEPGSVDRGLGFFQDRTAEGGTFRVMADRAQPAHVTTVVPMIDDVGPSPDGRFVLYTREDAQGFEKVFLARTDGAGECMLNALAEGEIFGLHFLDDARLVFWSEIDMSSGDGVAEGWVASTADCKQRQRYAPKSAFVTTIDDHIVIFGHPSPTGEFRYVLEHARIGNGPGPISPPTVVLDRTDATIAAFSDSRAIHLLVQVVDGPAESQGIYLYGPLPR
jgi:hypothetical protein